MLWLCSFSPIFADFSYLLTNLLEENFLSVFQGFVQISDQSAYEEGIIELYKICQVQN